MDNSEELLKAKINELESRIEVLQSEYEYQKQKLLLEIENREKWAIDAEKAKYDVKSIEDMQKIRDYYEQELKNQKEWWEKEVIKQKKETEDWHIKNLENKLNEQKTSYESIIREKDEELKEQEKTFNKFITEQKEIYEEQIRPFRKIIRLRNKIEKKFNVLRNNKEREKEEETIKPKVSVILPIYNVEKYLRQCLESLINQTLADIEIICVNDGSTDGCYDILEEYKKRDSRIRVIHKKNEGTGKARNEGLRIAVGECIGFVDPDDWVKANMFERLYREIKEKNLDIAMCMPDGFDEKNAENKPFPYFIDDNFKEIPVNKVFNWRDLSPFKYPMCVWNKLYTKKLFDENKIDFAQGLDFEDHKVIFGALLTAQRVSFIKEKLYVYRFNREGSILSDNNRRLLDHIKIFDIVENLMKETGTFDELKMDFLTYKVHNLLYYYGMIKDEFKKEYYEKMVKSLRETNINSEEYSILVEKYPELKEIKEMH